LAKLLAPTPASTQNDNGTRAKPSGATPLIEVIGGSSADGIDEEAPLNADDELTDRMEKLRLEREVFLEAERNDWRLPQTIPTAANPQPEILRSLTRPYGFLEMHSGYFRHTKESENDVNLLGEDAERCTNEERRTRREKQEDEKWDGDYYLADFVEDEEIRELTRWNGPYADAAISNAIEFTEEENLAMLRLPRKEYLITPSQSRSLYLALLTILFSYAYDLRTTQHDPTTESPWTISILTPCFSTLDTSPTSPNSPLAVCFRASYRRALAFPLYRNWVLCEKLREDVTTILRGGKRCVLRALLEAKKIIDGSDVYYVYSKIWLDDYCVWVQSWATDESLGSLAKEAQELKMSKRDIGWPLMKLETTALEGDSDDESESDIDSNSGDESMVVASL